MIDFIMNEIPFYFRNFVFIFGIFCIYLIVNLIISFASDNSVYSIMNWRSLDSYLYMLAMFAILILSFLIFVFLSSKKY